MLRKPNTILWWNICKAIDVSTIIGHWSNSGFMLTAYFHVETGTLLDENTKCNWKTNIEEEG